MADGVVTREATIVNERGLHARAAAKFVRTAETFTCRVEVTRDDQTVVGTSILGLMLLGAGAGVVLTLRAQGEDAEQAVATLGELIDRGFDE